MGACVVVEIAAEDSEVVEDEVDEVDVDVDVDVDVEVHASEVQATEEETGAGNLDVTKVVAGAELLQAALDEGEELEPSEEYTFKLVTFQ
jgi:hypothetical protein